MAPRTMLVTLLLAGAGVSEGVRRFSSNNRDTAADGQCSQEDVGIMEKLGKGTHEGSFPRVAAKCGEKSWSLFKGWQDKKYSSCLSDQTGMSQQCSACFSGSGKYGFQNCKAKCLKSWCSAGCLDCVAEYRETLVACVGSAPPDAPACDGKAALVEVGAGEGKCSAVDMAAMGAKGGGHSEGSFPALAAKCGRKAFKVLKGFKQDEFKACITEGTSIGMTCASCFADSGQYGVKNCKGACMGSWCSSKCLRCVNQHRDTLDQCVGSAPPRATEC